MNQSAVEKLLDDVAEVLTPSVGKSFFRHLVLQLARLLEVDFAFVGVLDKTDPKRVHTVAGIARGTPVENFSYTLTGAPCEHVIGRLRFQSYPERVRELFPADTWLTENGIESYLGIPLCDTHERPLGLIALLHSRRLGDCRRAESILKLCAARAGAELERLEANTERRHLEGSLRDMAHVLSSATGEDFFRALVLGLAQTLDADYVFVGEFDPQAQVVRTVAVSHEGRLHDNFEYRAVPATGHSHREYLAECYFADGVEKLCPNHEILERFKVQTLLGYPLSNANGEMCGILGVMQTEPMPNGERLRSILQICAARAGAELERMRTELTLRESEERFRHLTALSSDWYWEQDEKFRFTLVTHNSTTGKRFSDFEPVGKTRWELPYLDVPPETWKEHKRQLAAHEPFNNLILKRHDGTQTIRYSRISGVPIFDRHGVFRGYRGTGHDITERKHTEEQLSYLAYYDTLTGLPNRTRLLERLQQAMLDAGRVNRLVAAMFLDLDRFKYVNDTLGHAAGDGLLKAVAERLKGCVRPGDIIARLGGDEFMVVLTSVAHVDDVARVARKIVESFTQPFQVEGHELYTTTSIGITLYPFDEQDAEGLLKNADTAMYHAKEHGRNNFQFFTAELNTRAERRLRIETALRTALEHNEFSLHYQPQVNTNTGRILGMEALLRWTHPELGNVSPLEFIPVAEETGLILPIGEWVLREACRQTRDWHKTRFSFSKMQVAVNVSGKQLRQKDFPDLVHQVLKDTKLDSQYLDLELTESLLMEDVESTADAMHTLHDMGVSFSVDDFGTGYSSLAYLKRFPIDVLKIDRTFVRDIASDPNDVAIVKTIIAMAHTLGMKVVAEGVETYDQLRFLRAQGCDGSQGYYCGKPLAADEFTELLADWERLRQGRCQTKTVRRRAQKKSRPTTRRRLKK